MFVKVYWKVCLEFKRQSKGKQVKVCLELDNVSWIAFKTTC